MLLTQISTFVENTPGRFAIITDLLENANIDIRALSVAETTDFGLLRMIVSDADRAEQLLRGAGIDVYRKPRLSASGSATARAAWRWR